MKIQREPKVSRSSETIVKPDKVEIRIQAAKTLLLKPLINA